MTEQRYCYNPFTKEFFCCDTTHTIAIYNKGRQKQFDEYIRIIIIDDTLYIRQYYPFNDLSSLSLVELLQKSYELSTQYITDILELLKEYNITNIKYNVDNDLLRGIGLVNI